MNLAETLRGLLRRWYITFPGVVLAIAVAAGAWVLVPPSYERTATQLLLPGQQNIPVDSNPLLYLGGLSFAADVLVRAVGAQNTLDEITKDYPNATVDVARDGSSSGPFILITVSAPTNAEAGTILQSYVDRTATVLDDLQKNQGIASNNRITVIPVAVDATSTVQQRSRLVATAGSGVAVLALSLLLAGFVDGLNRQRRRRLGPEDDEESAEADDVPNDEGRDDEDDLGDDVDDGSGVTARRSAAERSRLARGVRRQRQAVKSDRSAESLPAPRRSR
jgi:hypothetical protein